MAWQVICFNKNSSIMQPNQLPQFTPLRVDLSLASSMSNRGDTNVVLICCFISPKHQSGLKLVWPATKKECYVLMLTMDATPAPVPENIVVFVLAATVVHMKVSICFTSSVVLKKIVHVTDCRVCTFSSCNWLINKIFNLTQYSFAAYAEYIAFSCRFNPSVRNRTNSYDRKGSAEKWSAYICMSLG